MYSPLTRKFYFWIARTIFLIARTLFLIAGTLFLIAGTLFVDTGFFETTAGKSFVGTDTNVDFLLSSIFPSGARSAIEIDFCFYSGLSSLRDSVTPVR
jgi:hypothetical protein